MWGLGGSVGVRGGQCGPRAQAVDHNRYARLHHRWQAMLYNFVLSKQQSIKWTSSGSQYTDIEVRALIVAL
eukprot:6491900-Amphidinium_carterae.1